MITDSRQKNNKKNEHKMNKKKKKKESKNNNNIGKSERTDKLRPKRRQAKTNVEMETSS